MSKFTGRESADSFSASDAKEMLKYSGLIRARLYIDEEVKAGNLAVSETFTDEALKLINLLVEAEASIGTKAMQGFTTEDSRELDKAKRLFSLSLEAKKEGQDWTTRKTSIVTGAAKEAAKNIQEIVRMYKERSPQISL